MNGVQGRGLLKRWFVVEKWVVVGESAGAFVLTWSYDRGLDWLLLGGSQVSKARPGAPFACFLVCGGRDGFIRGDERRDEKEDGCLRIVHALNLNRRGVWRSYNRYFK
jgi:hypothetical protein